MKKNSSWKGDIEEEKANYLSTERAQEEREKNKSEREYIEYNKLEES